MSTKLTLTRFAYITACRSRKSGGSQSWLLVVRKVAAVAQTIAEKSASAIGGAERWTPPAGSTSARLSHAYPMIATGSVKRQNMEIHAVVLVPAPSNPSG